MLGHGLSSVHYRYVQFKSFRGTQKIVKWVLGRELLSLLEDSVTALTAGVPVAMVGHEVSASAPVAEWAFSLQLAVLDLIVLANCI